MCAGYEDCGSPREQPTAACKSINSIPSQQAVHDQGSVTAVKVQDNRVAKMHKTKSGRGPPCQQGHGTGGAQVAGAAAAGGAKCGQAATCELPAATSRRRVYTTQAAGTGRQRHHRVLAGKSRVQAAQHRGGGDGKQRGAERGVNSKAFDSLSGFTSHEWPEGWGAAVRV